MNHTPPRFQKYFPLTMVFLVFILTQTTFADDFDTPFDHEGANRQKIDEKSPQKENDNQDTVFELKKKEYKNQSFDILNGSSITPNYGSNRFFPVSAPKKSTIKKIQTPKKVIQRQPPRKPPRMHRENFERPERPFFWHFFN